MFTTTTSPAPMPMFTQGRAQLAARFVRNTRVERSDTPLDDDQMRRAAPSIFAEGKHASHRCHRPPDPHPARSAQAARRPPAR